MVCKHRFIFSYLKNFINLRLKKERISCIS